ncbi:Decaprenyl-diphosphate synthase subunit 2 [Liparis tanakae]|uniref:Decaprenyl-diphosphate synthase subunit 2 n=1 Tax=Liparis tanakae TaxID=230148 RepID=A0A4Z2HWH4_9TELE|nr:Decaprenyl-diphosphate synthase subunit 2 [Liparis tanakae]
MMRSGVVLSDGGATDGVDVAAWEEHAFLSHGALLAKSCQAAMELAKHDKGSQRSAFKYGKHISLGHKPFVKSGAGEPASFSLTAAPVVFHRQIVGQERWRQQLQQVPGVPDS